MDFIGKVTDVLPVEEGVSARTGNPWKKKSWVAETFGQYPKKVKMDAMNANADSLVIEAGKVYNFSIDVESREYNGRWYSDIRVYRAVETVAPGMGNPVDAQPQGGASFGNQPSANPFQNSADPFSAGGAAGGAAFGNETDDLPF